MATAFLSYNSAQRDLALHLADKLGHDNCVIDKYHFTTGSPTLQQIFEEIAATDLFVLFLSEEALNSPWVKAEISYAETLKKEDIYNRVLIFVVDNSITHTDKRIPRWLRDIYTLHYISPLDKILIFKKIDSRLRDLNAQKHQHIIAKEKKFIGRNDLTEEFENKYYTADNKKPSCIIISGIEEVGRRSFTLNVLHKVSRLNKHHQQISITLNTRDSIEDFIIRIEDLSSNNSEETIDRIKDMELDAKITYAKQLLEAFKKNNEIIFIIDEICIVQPDKKIAPWFNTIINASEFNNTTVVCLISTIRPSNLLLRNRNYLTLHVNELSPSDTNKLFVTYCHEVFNINPSAGKINEIAQLLTGMPGQVYFAAETLFNEGNHRVDLMYEDIRKYNDTRVGKAIDRIENKGTLHNDIFTFISRIEFVSFHLIYKIYGRQQTTFDVLDDLYEYGIYDYLGPDKECLQVHHAFTDFVSRTKRPLSESTKQKLKQELRTDKENKNSYRDISEILYTLKSMSDAGQAIPERYLLPSFALRFLMENYYAGKQNEVKKIADRILGQHQKYDSGIIREIRYWYCLSLAKKFAKTKHANHADFFEQLNFFQYSSDYNFLYGFYLRLQGKDEEAEECFKKVLEIDEESQKAKREYVNVLLKQEKYDMALTHAKFNYQKKPNNIYHIQAYFISLIRHKQFTHKNKNELKSLLEAIAISHDPKAPEFYETMKGEYMYYVEDNLDGAIKQLKKAINSASNQKHPMKALRELYRRRGFRENEHELTEKIRSLDSVDEEDTGN